MMLFEGFDFTGFWKESKYAKETYGCGKLDQQERERAEAALGYKLPAAYVWLMEQHNGGVPVNTCFPANTPTNWADDHIAIEGIFGVWPRPMDSIVSETRLMVDKWGYPNIGVAICDCPTGGHQEVFLDYRKCGPQGEPAVVYVDQEDDYSILHLADNFEDFIRGLVNQSLFECDEEDGE